MLKTDKAMVVAAKISNECLRIGDIEPAFLPNDDTFRKMKSGKYSHLTFDKIPELSLREMKYAEPYQNCIGNIGMDPFDCYFGTPYQKELLRIETNRKKVIICFDATGVPIEKPKTFSFSMEHGRYKPIYLYVIMLQTKPGANEPVYQVLSQRQDATNIRFLLETWKANCLQNKHPDETITDNGAALVLASVKAFANCNSVAEYDNKCYDALFNDKKAPPTYIRLDRAHTVKSLLGYFKGLDRNKHRFYIRALGFLLTREDVNEAKTIIHSIFIVLLNRYQYADHVKTDTHT